MSTEAFFEESRQQSQVKSAIVSKYFDGWSKVMIGVQNKSWQRNADNRIAYVDLFAGPGRYSDGTVSTPLLILGKAVKDEELRQRLVTIFNDRDPGNAASLRKAIEELPSTENLKYAPQISSYEVGKNIVEKFETMRFVPTLFFVDPWGYKGLSLPLVDSILKDWGCDCIFFFNYNRINMGLQNDAVRKHMNALFGGEKADELRLRIGHLNPRDRELTIIEELCQAISEIGPQYVLPFRFKNDRGIRTSHHLIFISKHPKGYEIMKDIMAKESSDSEQGVASFEYNPASRQQPLLFEYSRPLDELGDMLLKHFAGMKLTMLEVFQQHNVNRPFIKRNYKQALLQLEAQGRIAASPHRKNTFADRVLVTFPGQGVHNYE